jgi:hypothetical protein
MLKRLLQRLDAFEDDPIAPVIGVMVLAGLLFAILLVPTPDMVTQ